MEATSILILIAPTINSGASHAECGMGVLLMFYEMDINTIRKYDKDQSRNWVMPFCRCMCVCALGNTQFHFTSHVSMVCNFIYILILVSVLLINVWAYVITAYFSSTRRPLKEELRFLIL